MGENEVSPARQPREILQSGPEYDIHCKDHRPSTLF
jgi:hypothetical protein